jgi:hypothetical protein
MAVQEMKDDWSSALTNQRFDARLESSDKSVSDILGQG